MLQGNDIWLYSAMLEPAQSGPSPTLLKGVHAARQR
jgi:hypothetical protein